MIGHNITNLAEFRPLTVDGTNYLLAAGTSDVDSTVVDTLGYESCTFQVFVGTMAASSACDFQVQQGAASDGSDMADLTGSGSTQVSATDDNKMVLITIHRPQERYLRLQTIRGDGGNTTINALGAILFNARHNVTQSSTYVVSSEIHVTPAEGTA